MDKLLVTANDINQYRPIAKEIVQDRIEVFIQEAQRHDLMPVLGNALFYDFITKYDQTGDPMYANYQALYNGSTWNYGGATKQHYGLKPIVAYYSLARMIANQQLNVTRYGVTTKVNPNSEPASDAAIRNLITELKSIAISYQDTTIQFLRDNAVTYPLFNQAIERPNHLSFRVFDI